MCSTDADIRGIVWEHLLPDCRQARPGDPAFAHSSAAWDGMHLSTSHEQRRSAFTPP